MAWASGQILTAAALNTEQSDLDTIQGYFPLGAGVWTAYTPTLTQGGAVTKTVTSARYMRTGRWITAQVALAVTGPGTAANAVLVGLPVQAFAAVCYGTGWILDASAGAFFAGSSYPSSGLVSGLLIGNAAGVGNVAGIAGFTAALAAGDTIQFNFNYESLT